MSTSSTHSEKKKVLAPKLRFKGYVNDWERKILGNTSEIIGGGTPETIVPEYWGGEIQWFTPTELKSKYVAKSKRTITELGLKNSSAKLLPKGSLLFSSRATVGDVSISLQEVTTNQGFQSFLVNKNNDTEFLYNWIIQNKKLFLRKAAGSTFLEISKKEIEKILIFIPTLPEQQKIASFLSAIDEKIQQLTRKKELLEQYKKGVMQQLFPPVGGQAPKLRFKDENGKAYPKWEEKKIGEIFTFKQGVQCAVEDQYVTQENGYVRFIRIVDLTKNDEPIRYIKDPGKEHHVKKKDLFMVRYGNPGILGYDYDGVIANNLFRIIPLVDKLDTKFFKYVFEYLKSDLDLLASSSTMPALNFTSLRTLDLKVPDFEEQQKIASYLSSLDTKIESVANQITQSQTFKKGLLQQMFV